MKPLPYSNRSPEVCNSYPFSAVCSKTTVHVIQLLMELVMEPKKVCNNCLEEGHSKSKCPHSNWCQRCKKDGHNVARCPEHAFSTCTNCYMKGHVKFQCPYPVTCHRCGSADHHTLACPTHPPWCGNCKHEGHIMSQCPRPSRCTRCHQEGHKSFQCSKPIKCSNCGKEGHRIWHCPYPVRCLRCNSEDHFTTQCSTYTLMCAKCGVKGHKAVNCHERKEELDTENIRVAEKGSKKHVTDAVTTSDGNGQPPQKPQAAPVPGVPAPRHHVQHPLPGPTPVPAPRRVRGVGSRQMMQESKDEVEIDVKLKMRQDEKLEQTGFARESINPLLINNVKKSGCPIPEQLLNQIIPIIHDNKGSIGIRNGGGKSWFWPPS